MAFSVWPTRLTSRRDKVEELMARRRNREADFRQTWENNSRYFKNSDLKSQKHMSLTSPASQQQSLEAFNNSKYQEERELWLQNRRSKLSSLLRSEDEKYEEEVKMLLSGSRHRKVLREGVPVQEDVPVPCAMQEVSSREVQIPSNDLKKVDKEDSYRVPVNAKSLVMDMKAKEAKADTLKAECRRLRDKLLFVDNCMLKRMEIIQRLKTLPWSNRLSVPYKVLMKMKGQEMIDFLRSETSLTEVLLQIVTDCSDDDLDLSFLKQEIYAVKDVTRSQLDEERQHLGETELLYHEEAASIWSKRNEEWERKLHERNVVVTKIANCIKTAINTRLADLLQQQKACLDEREKLLSQLQNSTLHGNSCFS